jgi:hypothetical protein
MGTKHLSIKKEHLYIVLIALAVCLFESCHKDNSISPKSSPPSIGFQPSSLLDTAVLTGKSTDMFDLEVTLSVPSNISSTVSATVVPDTGALNGYNAYQQKHAFTPPQGWTGRSFIPFRQLPASAYTLQNGGKVAISPGQTSITVRVNFAGDKIDFYNNNAFKNALSLKLTGANGATLTDGLSGALILIRAQSPYEGNYQTTGTEVSSGVTKNYSFTQLQPPLTSVTPNTILKQGFGSYSGLMYLTVNPDNSVSINFLVGIPGPFYVDGLGNNMIYPGAAPLVTYSQTGVNKYDPTTKTFTLNYQDYISNVISTNVTETLTLK